jgi:Fibronectin type III domain
LLLFSSVIVPGHTNEAQVQKLSPATTYNIRIVAENEIGTSDNSEVVTIITAEEGKLTKKYSGNLAKSVKMSFYL